MAKYYNEYLTEEEFDKIVKEEAVNHKSQYPYDEIKVIDFIIDNQLGFCLGNAVMFIAMANKKDKSKEIERLEKAIWHINRRIKELKEE